MTSPKSRFESNEEVNNLQSSFSDITNNIPATVNREQDISNLYNEILSSYEDESNDPMNEGGMYRTRYEREIATEETVKVLQVLGEKITLTSFAMNNDDILLSLYMISQGYLKNLYGGLNEKFSLKKLRQSSSELLDSYQDQNQIHRVVESFRANLDSRIQERILKREVEISQMSPQELFNTVLKEASDFKNVLNQYYSKDELYNLVSESEIDGNKKDEIKSTLDDFYNEDFFNGMIIEDVYKLFITGGIVNQQIQNNSKLARLAEENLLNHFFTTEYVGLEVDLSSIDE